ncbi:MAG: hypothetical protein V7741_03240, partial [Hyphomonas sp.]
GDGDIRTKADEARLLMLALGLMMSKDGERIGALGAGRTPSFGKRAVDRLAEDISNGAGRPFPPPPRSSATLVIASDFYDPITEWQARLKPLAARCPEGVLLAVAAPIELDFPFQGRVKLHRPGDQGERILGRAETMRDEYKRKFAEQREALLKLATQIGWRLVTHTTATPSLHGAAHLKMALESFGARG